MHVSDAFFVSSPYAASFLNIAPHLVGLYIILLLTVTKLDDLLRDLGTCTGLILQGNQHPVFYSFQ